MDFIHQDSHTVYLTQLFNEEHAALLFQQKLALKPDFNKIILKDVGVKIMRDAFEKFQEQGITDVVVEYNWNDIMMFPKLVCYDKNTWKTVQQLTNWNTEWSKIFSPAYSIRNVALNITCSWADDEFIKAVLEGLKRLPNIKSVEICVKSKNGAIAGLLGAVEKAQIFPSFKGEYVECKE